MLGTLVVRRNESAALHRHRLVPMDPDARLDDPVGLGERGVQVADVACAGVRDVVVVLVEQRRLRGIQRVRIGDDGLQELDLFFDELDRVLGEVAVLGHDQRDRVADVPDLVRRQGMDGRRAEIRHQVHPDRASGRAGVGEAHEVLAGVDRDHTGELSRRRHVDRHQTSMRDGAALERGVEHSRQHDVVDVPAASGQDPRVLASQDARTDRSRSDFHHACPPYFDPRFWQFSSRRAAAGARTRTRCRGTPTPLRCGRPPRGTACGTTRGTPCPRSCGRASCSAA